MTLHPSSPTYLHRVHRNTLTVWASRFSQWYSWEFRSSWKWRCVNGILSFTLPFKRPQISSSFLYETGYNNSQKLVNLTVCSLYIYSPNGACLNTHPWHEQHVQHSQFTLDNTCTRKKTLTCRIISKKTAKFLHAGVVLTKVVASLHHHPTKKGTR